jgi:hypothetical protein
MPDGAGTVAISTGPPSAGDGSRDAALLMDAYQDWLMGKPAGANVVALPARRA